MPLPNSEGPTELWALLVAGPIQLQSLAAHEELDQKILQRSRSGEADSRSSLGYDLASESWRFWRYALAMKELGSHQAWHGNR